MAKPDLSNVTLCAATSVNVAATVAALDRSRHRIKVARTVIFTHDEKIVPPEGIEKVLVPRMNSALDYTDFILDGLPRETDTDFALVAQWDGFVSDPDCWDPAFLDYDYLGAPWPQFDQHDVGNGGFSLRSRKLMESCLDERFVRGEVEDIAICRVNRRFLEQEYGLRFPSTETAARFSYERGPRTAPSFDFHGIFNMPEEIGVEDYWALYRELDEPKSAFVDFWPILAALGKGKGGLKRQAAFIRDRLGR